MSKWSRTLVGVLAVTSLRVLVTHAGAETCTLEMKRVDASARGSSSGKSVDSLFRSTYPQGFFQQFGGPQGMSSRSDQGKKPEFSEVIKKEPAEYATATPFRGVVALGTGHYGFVLDIAVPQEEESKEEEKEKADGAGKTAEAKEEKDKAEGAGGIFSMLAKALVNPLTSKSRSRVKTPHFTRLYFDRNHNGDLTDDEVIQAESEHTNRSSTNQASFPTVELTIDVDGKKVDYAFTFSVYSYGSGTYSYANASLNAAAYREGEIMLGGVKRRVVLVDFNSNGRFDDVGGVNDEVQLSDGTIYPKMGDMLYLDPQASGGYRNPYDSTGSKDQYQVNRLIAFDHRFYDLKIDPSGATLALEPSSAPVGYLINPNRGFRALIYGDQGALEIDDHGTGKTPVPEGQWKLMSYTIEQSESAKPEADVQNQKGEKKQGGSILELLRSAFSMTIGQPMGPRLTVVSARAKRDFKAVQVVEGETAEMRFGPPYLPTVEAQNLQPGMRTLSLGMSLVGTGGEVCSNLLVKGNRPEAPEFTISTKDGEEVAAGKFKYG